MAAAANRAILLKERPVGAPTDDTFELSEITVPDPGPGEFLVRNIWMSVDPYMRGRMFDRKSYIEPFQVGEPLSGGCIGQVIASNNDSFPVGTYVSGMMGWREHWISDGAGVMPVDPNVAPVQTFLGTLGMPGMTAYAGLLRVGGLKEGETVFVSAASGAVGSVVCQIAKIKGCRVVGSAGSDEKVAWLRHEAGVDHAFNYRKTTNYVGELSRACPDGIDLCFENVGGSQLEAALLHMKDFGRVVICGLIEQYNSPEPPPGPRTFIVTIMRRLRIEGFIVTDHLDLMPEFFQNMTGWIAEGKIKWRETVLEGLENAPKAFMGLFTGENFGKMLVKIGPDPAV